MPNIMYHCTTHKRKEKEKEEEGKEDDMKMRDRVLKEVVNCLTIIFF